jgi:hypothetical protein
MGKRFHLLIFPFTHSPIYSFDFPLLVLIHSYRS